MGGIEQERLHVVVHARYRQQCRLHGLGPFHVAACQQAERPERKAAAQQAAPFQGLRRGL